MVISVVSYDSGASLSVRAKQSARRRSKTYILLLLTNLLHRSSARQRRDETRAGPFRPTLTGAIPRPSVDFFAIRTGTPYPYPNLDPLDLALRCLRYLTYKAPNHYAWSRAPRGDVVLELRGYEGTEAMPFLPRRCVRTLHSQAESLCMFHRHSIICKTANRLVEPRAIAVLTTVSCCPAIAARGALRHTLVSIGAVIYCAAYCCPPVRNEASS